VKVTLLELAITTRKSVEILPFSPTVTFLYGPVGTGKSTVARLIDYCFGGDLERTPAIQQEFVAVRLSVVLGLHHCQIERASLDGSSVRVSWEGPDGQMESISAPLAADENPILHEHVFNLSDLLFFLCGVEPIKVRKRFRDADSPMIRLSFRDVWWYCYLEQTHLDSSFFKLDDAFKGRKSQDAMRFFTGLHSERQSQLETELYRLLDLQKGKREAVLQIRQFMRRFEFGSEDEIEERIERTKKELEDVDNRRRALDQTRDVTLHPTDPLRTQLRHMGSQLASLQLSIEEASAAIEEQRALKAELVTTKVKADRTEQAGKLLTGVEYERCPQCAADLSTRTTVAHNCRLCGSPESQQQAMTSLELESVRRELNERIDQLGDAIRRRESALLRSQRQAEQLQAEKTQLDRALQQQLAKYDSAFMQSVRSLDRESATLTERLRALEQLKQMPRAITELEDQAAALEASVDRVRQSLEQELSRLRYADDNVEAIAARFKQIMLSVGFPGVSTEDRVRIDARNWKPEILHGDQIWTFSDAGSGGKKTLFNVCYALAIHEVARERDLPVPSVLIIDSPTKNISEDENPELVSALYREIYRLASKPHGQAVQLLLIDSNLVLPDAALTGFASRHIAAEPDAPSLIPYYIGP
jgi:hypothetical protein